MKIWFEKTGSTFLNIFNTGIVLQFIFRNWLAFYKKHKQYLLQKTSLLLWLLTTIYSKLIPVCWKFK